MFVSKNHNKKAASSVLIRRSLNLNLFFLFYGFFAAVWQRRNVLNNVKNNFSRIFICKFKMCCGNIKKLSIFHKNRTYHNIKLSEIVKTFRWNSRVNCLSIQQKVIVKLKRKCKFVSIQILLRAFQSSVIKILWGLLKCLQNLDPIQN